MASSVTSSSSNRKWRNYNAWYHTSSSSSQQSDAWNSRQWYEKDPSDQGVVDTVGTHSYTRKYCNHTSNLGTKNNMRNSFRKCLISITGHFRNKYKVAPTSFVGVQWMEILQFALENCRDAFGAIDDSTYNLRLLEAVQKDNEHFAVDHIVYVNGKKQKKNESVGYGVVNCAANEESEALRAKDDEIEECRATISKLQKESDAKDLIISKLREELKAKDDTHVQVLEAKDYAHVQELVAKDLAILELQEHLNVCTLRCLSTLSIHGRSSRFTLERTDPLFKFCSENFIQSFRGHRRSPYSGQMCPPATIDITGIELLQNGHLTQQYILQNEGIQTSCNNIDVGGFPLRGNINEYILFHGATDQVLQQICEKGFDSRRSGETSGALFGSGSYFAEDASKADFYAKPQIDEDAASERVVMLARVPLGDIYCAKVKKNFKHPPYKDANKTEMYDSVCALRRDEGGCVDFREYIVYGDNRALPLAMIRYCHRSDCTCNNCSRIKNL